MFNGFKPPIIYKPPPAATTFKLPSLLQVLRLGACTTTYYTVQCTQFDGFFLCIMACGFLCICTFSRGTGSNVHLYELLLPYKIAVSEYISIFSCPGECQVRVGGRMAGWRTSLIKGSVIYIFLCCSCLGECQVRAGGRMTGWRPSLISSVIYIFLCCSCLSEWQVRAGGRMTGWRPSLTS